MKSTKTLNAEGKRLIRKAAGCHLSCNYPVVVVEGSITPPTELGRVAHYVTKAGNKIDHPSAYAKKGWGGMAYIASDKRIEVGRDWLRHFAHTLLMSS
jgi:hypothetical protein